MVLRIDRAAEERGASPDAGQNRRWLGQNRPGVFARPRLERPSPSTAEPRNGILIPLIASLAFLGVGIAISKYAGTDFAALGSGEIPGLHVNYWIPPIAAAIGYLLLQCTTHYVGPVRPSWRTIAQRAAGDYLLLGLFILVVYVHFNIKMWIPVINPHEYDRYYFAVDHDAAWLIGLFEDVRNLLARILPGADLWYQAAFFAVFVLSFLCHALGRRRFHYHNMTALLLIESIGPLTYLIAPAVGPFIYQRGVNMLATTAELQMLDVYNLVRSGGVDWIRDHGAQFFAQPLAAMPSLHVGASFIIAYYAVKARLWVSPVAVCAFCWIFIESVAARWHYLVDLPAGMLLAFAVIALTNHLYRRFPADRKDVDRPAAGRRKPAAAGVSAAAAPTSALRSASRGRPTVWVLKCHRPGDHAQSVALAQALGWPFEVKEMEFHWYELFFALASCATLAGVDRRRSSLLAPPWPDLIILAGRRNETPAKWVRKQSGGRTRIVVIGRYWTPPSELDFVVTTPQFRLPAHPNVLHNTLPLQPLRKMQLAEAARRWAPRLAGTRRPYVTLLVGGSSGPYRFSRETARRLGREATAFARTLGATLLVSTSARTPRRIMRTLENAIEVPCHFYRWRPDDPENPHFGFLALADAIIVTGDSLSMLAEACSMGRPVHIFEFGGGPAAMHGPRSADPRIRQWWRWSQLKDQGILGLPYAFAIGCPAWRLNRSRDIRLAQDRAIGSGLARWLGGNVGPEVRPAPPEDLALAVDCIRRLMQVQQEARGRGHRPALEQPMNGREPAGAEADPVLVYTVAATRQRTLGQP